MAPGLNPKSIICAFIMIELINLSFEFLTELGNWTENLKNRNLAEIVEIIV